MEGKFRTGLCLPLIATLLVSGLFSAFSASDACADGGEIGFQTGETLFQYGTSISEAFLFVKESERSKTEEEKTFLTTVNYGFTENLTLGLLIPYTEKEERITTPKGREHLGDSGLVDITLTGKYRFYFSAEYQRETTAAVIFGLQPPTGHTNKKEKEGRLEPELQLGSGAVDGLLGLAATHEWGRFGLNGYLLYQLNNQGAQGFKHGDFLFTGAILGWRPISKKYPGPELGLSLGLNYVHEGHSERRGRIVPDMGRDTLFLSPSVFGLPRTGDPAAVRLFLSVDIPIYQRVNGEELEFDYRSSFGLTVGF